MTDLPDLDAAIKQLCELGESDPIEIAQKLERRYDESWHAEQLSAYRQDIYSMRARQELSARRRRAEVALRPGDVKASAEFRIVKAWVPGVGQVVAAELTPEHLEAKAKWYEDFAGASLRRAEWCRSVARMIRDQGCKKLGQLKKTLPPLPDPPELEGGL